MAQKEEPQEKKQALYRDARFTNQYDQIWQSVGKCVFCDLREKYILFEENGVVMTITLFAYVDGHFMIIPRRHVTSAKELTQLEWETVRKFMYIAKRMVKTVHGVKGMQFIQKDGPGSQSTVEHYHFQCLPFDSPDLSVWNYRKLKHTPLENVALYKKDRKEILRTSRKFEQKYRNPSGLPVVCDAIIINDKHEILFEERKPEYKLSPDYITLPGGHIDDFATPLIAELTREVYEEVNYKLKPNQLKLHTSEISTVTYRKVSKSLHAAYDSPQQFLWNTYIVRVKGDESAAFKPGDDAQSLLWISIKDISQHSRISSHTKDVLSRISL